MGGTKTYIFFESLKSKNSIRSLKHILKLNLSFIKWNKCLINRKHVMLFRSQKAPEMYTEAQIFCWLFPHSLTA